MMNDVKELIVQYNGNNVGYLKELENKTIAFQYSESWVKNGFSISPISLPLSNEVYISKSPYFEGLFGVFYDSLPDGFGELLIRRKINELGYDYDKLTVLTKLSFINENGLGGLVYKPTQSQKDSIKEYDLDELSEEIKKLFEQDYTGASFDEIYKLGGASGGARPKVHLMIDDVEWIIKFPSSLDPINIGEKEFKANQLAQKSGIDVNQHHLFSSRQCSGYFGAKRFDREHGKRKHVISLAALLETTHVIPNLDYKVYLQVIKKICMNERDLYEGFRRMAFNVLYGNKDDHSKNFAFIYNDEKNSYELSKAYDITKTMDKYEHEMTVMGNGKPTKKSMMNLAEVMKLSKKKCQSIIDRVEEEID